MSISYMHDYRETNNIDRCRETEDFPLTVAEIIETVKSSTNISFITDKTVDLMEKKAEKLKSRISSIMSQYFSGVTNHEVALYSNYAFLMLSAKNLQMTDTEIFDAVNEHLAVFGNRYTQKVNKK